MGYLSNCLKMVIFECFIRVFLAKNFLATENVKNMPIFDQKWATFQNFRRLRRRKAGHFSILITPPFGRSLPQYRVLMYIFIRASIGGVTCQKLGGWRWGPKRPKFCAKIAPKDQLSAPKALKIFETWKSWRISRKIQIHSRKIWL